MKEGLKSNGRSSIAIDIMNPLLCGAERFACFVASDGCPWICWVLSCLNSVVGDKVVDDGVVEVLL